MILIDKMIALVTISIISALVLCAMAIALSVKALQPIEGQSWREWTIYVFAPYGLAIAVFLYAFFWREARLLAFFEELATMPFLLDLFLNIVLPGAAVLGLYLLYVHAATTDSLSFVICIAVLLGISWLYLSILVAASIDLNGWPDRHYDMPLVQWCIAFYISVFWIAVDQRNKKADHHT